MGVIEFENVVFTYDGEHRALDGVTLSVEEGSFVCVLGGNGSGKSTLAKHVNALLVPDEGRVRVLGHDTADESATFAIRSNAGMVFQNPDDQIVASIIEDDVAFGPENLGVPTDELRRRVDEALQAVGLQGFQKRETNALSGGQKQRVAIAGVLAMRPRIIVFDEASAMLDPRGRAGLSRVCRELHEAGLTVIRITHFMEEAVHADRVVVLQDGRVAADGTPDAVLSDLSLIESLALDTPNTSKLCSELAAAGLPIGMHVTERALLAALGDACTARGIRAATVRGCICGGEAASGAGGDDVLAFDHVSFTYQPTTASRFKRRFGKEQEDAGADWGRSPDEYWAVRDVSFSLREGEFFGLAGHTGSGKSTLFQLAGGLISPNEGRVLVRGADISSKREAAQARRDVGLVFQYPEHQLFAASVFDDVAFGPRNMGLASDEVAERVREALALVHLDVDEIGQTSPFALSGGQQRRVAFAGVLAMRPSTLILDEPTAGLDPRAHERLLNLIAELHDTQRMTTMLISHNMDDLARYCGRLLVLNRGTVHAVGTPAEVFADEGSLSGIGLGVPYALHIVNKLAEGGVDVSWSGGVPELADVARGLAGSCGA